MKELFFVLALVGAWLLMLFLLSLLFGWQAWPRVLGTTLAGVTVTACWVYRHIDN
jgi:hypothetical protein